MFLLRQASILFLKELGHSGINIPHLDKIAHMGIFFVLALLLDYGFKNSTLDNICGLSIYGVVIEILQSLTGYREASFADFIADFLGIISYFILSVLIQSGQKENGQSQLD